VAAVLRLLRVSLAVQAVVRLLVSTYRQVAVAVQVTGHRLILLAGQLVFLEHQTVSALVDI
jgi:hypothetical protein